MTEHETAQLQKLQISYPGAKPLPEGGRTVVLLPGVTLFSAEKTYKMDLLLCPFEHTGYPTRLLFEHEIPGKGQNWKTLYVAGKNWSACSWTGVPANADWPAILCAHLRAVA
jgi:hypothetical protein